MTRVARTLTERRFTALGMGGMYVAGNIAGLAVHAPWWAGFPVGAGVVALVTGLRALLSRRARTHPQEGS